MVQAILIRRLLEKKNIPMLVIRFPELFFAEPYTVSECTRV